MNRLQKFVFLCAHLQHLSYTASHGKIRPLSEITGY